MTKRGRRPLLLALTLGLLAGCSAEQPRFMHPPRGGMPGHHLARASCPTPAEVRGRRVDVVLMDGGPMMGSRLRAWPVQVGPGPVTFVATNHGGRTHELVVLPLAAGEPAGVRRAVHGRVDESGSLGEASASCAAGEGDGIRPGRTGWVTLDLSPGHYELVCNEPRHYAAGMYQSFVVTS